jgi:hypothetical protein
VYFQPFTSGTGSTQRSRSICTPQTYISTLLPLRSVPSASRYCSRPLVPVCCSCGW